MDEMEAHLGSIGMLSLLRLALDGKAEGSCNRDRRGAPVDIGKSNIDQFEEPLGFSETLSPTSHRLNHFTCSSPGNSCRLEMTLQLSRSASSPQ